jgi:hypothetical protein
MRNQSTGQSDFDNHTRPNRSQLASGGKDSLLRTAAHSLDTFTDPASTHTRERWDWPSGTVTTVHANILDNARTNMARLKNPTVTSARAHPDRNAYGFGRVYGSGGLCAPAPAPAPPMTSTSTKKSNKTSKTGKGK